MTSEKIQVRYFSGYIRNWKKLCTELGISCGLDRKEREKAIIEKAYEKWEMAMMEHIYGMFAIALWDSEKKKLFCIKEKAFLHKGPSRSKTDVLYRCRRGISLLGGYK